METPQALACSLSTLIAAWHWARESDTTWMGRFDIGNLDKKILVANDLAAIDFSALSSSGECFDRA